MLLTNDWRGCTIKKELGAGLAMETKLECWHLACGAAVWKGWQDLFGLGSFQTAGHRSSKDVLEELKNTFPRLVLGFFLSKRHS